MKLSHCLHLLTEYTQISPSNQLPNLLQNTVMGPLLHSQDLLLAQGLPATWTETSSITFAKLLDLQTACMTKASTVRHASQSNAVETRCSV